jgi:glycosyltransferase involved in cell wall biosynthesis
VSDHEIQHIRRKLRILADATVISTVARLRHEKGLHVALTALPLVAKAVVRPLHYVIVGDRPDLDRLRAQAHALPTPVHFVGHQDTVGPWYALADIVWMPSLNEAFGISAAEAMSYGRPLIASAVGGLQEVVSTGERGVLVPPQDPSALAGATLELLQPPAPRLALGQAARARYNSMFTPQRAIEGIVSCYQELLETEPVTLQEGRGA